MKILHAAETIKGGVATVLKQIVEAQISQSEVTSVLCIVPYDQVTELSIIKSKNILTFKRSGRNLRSYLAFSSKFINSIIKIKPDVVHLHSTFAGVMGRLILLLISFYHRPKAIVYCPHAFAFMMDGSSLKKTLYVNIEKFLLRFTDLVICVSMYEKKTAMELGLKASKLRLIYNGVIDKNVERVNTKKNNIELLFVGRLDFQKGYDILAKAMNLLNNEPFHLTVVGDYVHGSIEKEELKNITYVGWVNSIDIEKYFINADALVIPSRWEGFAMVPLEAMSYSLPIIASDSTSFPEVVLDGETGFLFESGNSVSLYENLMKLKNNNLFAMGKKGHDFFRENFLAKTMIDKTLALYAELVVSRNK
jgi:glycosyltransferase involved in cell wall biosynthesis